jgi:small conductance mechanosensitive channel
VSEYITELFEHWVRTLLAQIPNLLQALLVIAVAVYVAQRIQLAVERLVGRERRHRELARLLGRLVRIAVLVGGLLLVLGIFNQTQILASFLASLGIFGLLVAFALQDITKNFAAGILLLIQRPFALEDRIRVGLFEGVVVDVSLRATVLRTADGHEVLIPNADVYSGAITNLTRYPLRRHTVAIALPIEIDGASAQHVLEATLRRVPQIVREPRPVVVSTGVGVAEQQFEARFWIPSTLPELPAVVGAAVLGLQQGVQMLKGIEHGEATSQIAPPDQV